MDKLFDMKQVFLLMMFKVNLIKFELLYELVVK